jgi:minor extracellular serine protease Vpr
LLIVKITSDGAPAHGSEPAEAPAWDPARIPVGLRWLVAESVRRRQPIVVSLNLGSISGPTDGTSSLTRLIDEEFAPGKPGRVFICGTGDDGVNTLYRACSDGNGGSEPKFTYT